MQLYMFIVGLWASGVPTVQSGTTSGQPKLPAQSSISSVESEKGDSLAEPTVTESPYNVEQQRYVSPQRSDE